MKIKTRIISVLMIMMMVITGMSFSAYAATPSKGTVYVDVTQDNAMAKKVLAQVNKQRAKKGLRKLKLDKSLTSAAVQRAAEISMVIPTTSPHKRPDGRYAKTAHKLAARENCAEGYFSGPKALVSDWMHSKAHKANILFKSARSCGIAYVHNPADADTGYYVLILSTSKVKSKLTSSKEVSSTKKVVALSKYLKKKYFIQEVSKTKLNPGDAATVNTYYFGPKTMDFTSPLINAKSFTWTSSDTGVAKVSAKGVVTAVGPGSVTIKAKLKKGPKIILSKTFTVSSYEENFDKLTDYMTTKYDTYFGEDGYGYTEGGCYVKKIFGMRAVYDSYEDPETGETEYISYDNHGCYVFAMESKLGEELSFAVETTGYENKEYKYLYRTFMIISKEEGQVSDTLTIIHDYLDEDDNCVYRLTATAPRNAVDIYNLEWEVLENNTGEEIDYELISDHLHELFVRNTFYLYNKTGVKLGHLGIKRAS